VAHRDLLQVTLEYTDIDWLFKEPNVSLISEDFHEYSTTAGLEYICNEVYANPLLKRVEATILLAPERITPDLEQRTREAVRRYCLARVRETGQDGRALQWRALRALMIAIVFFVAYVIVERPLYNSEIWFLNGIGEGVGIGIWVALWFPLDALIFGVPYYRMDSESYRRVSEMQLRIKPAY
jgi:hypothetical protein